MIVRPFEKELDTCSGSGLFVFELHLFVIKTS